MQQKALAMPEPPPRKGRIASLSGVSEALGNDLAPKEALRLILQAAYSSTRATSASLMLLRPGTDILQVKVAEGFRDDSIYRTRLRVGQGVTGWVAETGVPLRVGNVAKDARYVRVQKGLRSELAVPLKIRGRTIGVISVDSTKLNHFSADDEALLVSLAAHSARLIESTRLHQQTRKRAQELQFLMDAGRALAASLNLLEVLHTLAEMTAEHFDGRPAMVLTLHDDGAHLELGAAHGGKELFEFHALPLQGSVWAEVLAAKDVLEFRDGDARLDDPSLASLRASGINYVAAVPLEAKRRPLGILAVCRAGASGLGSDACRLLGGLGGAAALALDNALAHRRMMETEEKLRQSEKTSLLVELAGTLSHEIRNPLTSLKILFESLVASQSWSEEQREDQQMIRRQVQRLEQIVENYLESSRTHAAMREPRPLDLNTVVDESLLLLASSAHEGTRLVCNLAEGELTTLGDATQLSQAVYNLVLNALQAVGQQNRGARGRIEILTGRLEREGPGGSEVFFEVADDGPGLCAEVKARLFQPFVTTKKDGVGLGLSIVKRIVEAHGGRLDIESPRAGLQHGARFRVVLPAQV
ncbi:MAG: GAF domain-containing protein [Planctomycetota bacterium]|nr:GAF domain-containing protein [Planctomycetota bacterium]